MNAQEFKQKTGRDPVQDDLQRANCDKAGTVGHADCGVCAFCGIPNWLCFGHSIKEVNSRIASLEEDKRKLIEALSEILDCDTHNQLHRDPLDTDEYFMRAKFVLGEVSK